MVKNPSLNAGDIKDVGSIPGSGRSLEEDITTYSSILACKIPWTEEFWHAAVHRVTESDTTEPTEHTHTE